MIRGGVVPTGNWRTVVCPMAVICAMAPCTFVPGRKNTLITPRPYTDWDSMCSMSLTVVVIPRSELATMRSAISWSAITTNVEGRRRANATIHIDSAPLQSLDKKKGSLTAAEENPVNFLSDSILIVLDSKLKLNYY